MSVDPNIDYSSHDPEDREEVSSDPKLRAVQEREARMRAALATKENPMHDDESMHDRLRRVDEEAGAAREQDDAPAPRDDDPDA